MNENMSQFDEWSKIDCDALEFDELENRLESELGNEMSKMEVLEQEAAKIGNPVSLGETVMNVVWEQFINQVGVVAGEDFIKENRELKLDLRDSAHIQTTTNFEKGKIAKHNDKIDYQQRYDDWQSNFQYDNNGHVITHKSRIGKDEATLVSNARKPFDQGRPTGSVENKTDMDHTISAGEIIRDSEANTHLTKDEQIAFANSDKNLNEMDARHNRSKGDKAMAEWLDNPNANGQKPNEIFDISEQQDNAYRKKDAEAREEYETLKKEGEKRSIETGKQSQKEEAMRIGGKALRAVVMGLLASLIKDIVRKLIVWFRTGKRKLSTFIDSVKEAIKSFVSNLKEHILNACNTLLTTIATAIVGPVIGMIKKAWIFLKQGYNSVKQAITFLKNPENKNMPFNLKLMHVGKIVIVGLTAGGAIVLSEAIEKGLLSIPGFAFEIPLLGSLANVIGMFLGALVSGIIGALALNVIDSAISKNLKQINLQKQIEKKSEIINIQGKLIGLTEERVDRTKIETLSNISLRHSKATKILDSTVQEIMKNSEVISRPLCENAEIVLDDSELESENKKDLDDLFEELNSLK